MKSNHIIIILCAIPALLLAAPARYAHAQWENLRRAGASSYLIGNTTGEYLISHTVGEPSATLLQLEGHPPSILSGYLSQIPSNSLSFDILNFESSGAVVSEGLLLVAGESNSFKFAFSNDISTETVAAGMEVREVVNNLGEPVNSTRAVSVAYFPNEAAFALSSTEAWNKGSVYAIRYSSWFADTNGISLARETTYYFTVKMDHQKNNTAVALNDLKTRVRLPAGAYSSDFFIIISTAQTSPAIKNANRKFSALSGGAGAALTVLNATSFDEAGNAVQPSSPCVVSFQYNDADGDGIVDGSFPPVKVKNLAVWRLDDRNQLWVKQTGADTNPQTGEISLRVAHFSSYALMAAPDTDVSPVYAYPVPFRPNAGNTARYGDWTDLITFTSLPASGKIRIYTITGDLARELDVTPPEMKWDVRNSAGEPVASGVYIWEIVSGKNRKTGKLIVVK